MSYPHQHHQQAVRQPRITVGQRIQGAFALLVVLGLTVGLPYALLFLTGNPLTNGVLDPANFTGILTTPDDGTLFMILLQLVAWVAWVALALSIVVELLSQIRGVRAPHLPGLGMPQGVARGLVGAVMLLFTVVPGGGQAVAASVDLPGHDAGPSSSVSMSADRQGPTTPGGPGGSGPGGQQAERDAGGAAHRSGHVGKEVVVQPGDTLWDIAETELGDGSRYPALYEASQDVNQPGGARLQDPDLILPGWTVEVPGAGERAPHDQAPRPQQDGGGNAGGPDVSGAEQVAAPGGAAGAAEGGTAGGNAGAGGNVGAGGAASSFVPGGTGGGGVVGQDGSVVGGVGGGGVVPGGGGPARDGAPAGAEAPGAVAAAGAGADAGSRGSADERAAAEGLSVEAPWQVATATGLGALLAAGLVTLLARRRRDQQRTRRPGQEIPQPPRRATGFEHATRAGADQPSVETIDIALRALADHCARSRQPLPAVRAARLTAGSLELYLAAPARLPGPWTQAGDGTVWALAARDAARLGRPPAAPAPYPALVTIGYDDELGHVLLNLENLGSLGITGDPAVTGEILAALALELATSVWADELQVTVVGALGGLEPALRTGRVRHVPEPGRVVEDLRRRAEADRAALAAHRATDLHAARAAGALPDAWDPEIVLLGGPVPPDTYAELASLASALPQVALATVTGGNAVGQWALHVEPGGRGALLAPIGLRLRPQRLPAPQLDQVVELAAAARPAAVTGQAWPEPSVSQVEIVPPVEEPARRALPPAVGAGAVPAAGAGTGAVAGAGVGVPPAADAGAAPVDAGTGAATAVRRGTRSQTANAPVARVGGGGEDGSVAPRILLLGPVDVEGARGAAEDRYRDRLMEYAAFLGLHDGPASFPDVEAAMWPGVDDAPAQRAAGTARLRRWLGQDDAGGDFVPRHEADGVGFSPAVTTDVDAWDRLVARDPRRAPTQNLVGALRLVRGVPFAGVHPRRYAWAAPLRERLIAEVVDVSFELARRHLEDGRWRSADDAAAVGLGIEPAQESLWRMRILAAHQGGDRAGEEEAVDELLSITERLESDLTPETERLLAALSGADGDTDALAPIR